MLRESTSAADQGLEPQLTAPEAVVLPLDESAISTNYRKSANKAKENPTPPSCGNACDGIGSFFGQRLEAARRLQGLISKAGFSEAHRHINFGKSDTGGRFAFPVLHDDLDVLQELLGEFVAFLAFDMLAERLELERLYFGFHELLPSVLRLACRLILSNMSRFEALLRDS